MRRTISIAIGDKGISFLPEALRTRVLLDISAQPMDDVAARFKTCFQLDGAARGECLATIARELSGASSFLPNPVVEIG